MDKLFLTILNMSITGAFVIAAVYLARLFLKKAPKIMSYYLWAVVAFRLICPFTIESVFSLIPFGSDPVPIESTWVNIPYSNAQWTPNSGIPESPVKYPGDIPPTTYIVEYCGFFWLTGVVLLAIYGITSYILLKRKMRGAVHFSQNIYEADNIKSPFVLGIIKPQIYLPLGLSDKERVYILLHEQTHIRRCDHIVKFCAFFVLCLHWFNPLVWVAFILMGVDMEMSCDERVLKEIGGDTKKDYSRSLLSLATERRIISGSPLAFGEGGVKQRIKNVLNFKKPSRIIVLASVMLVAVLSVGFASNRVTDGNESSTVVPVADGLPRMFFLENATERQKFERLLSITLHDDGKAELAAPLISSYLLPTCTYSIVDGELLIYAGLIPNEEEMYSLKKEDVVARFTVADDSTLIFKDASVPLYVDAEARYVYMPPWISFDGSKITVHPQNIPTLEVFHIIEGQVHEFLVSLADDESFALWAESLVLERVTFPVGEYPGDNDGGEAYMFKTSFGGRMFEYGKYGGNENYVFISGEWYHVKNPSDPFPKNSSDTMTVPMSNYEPRKWLDYYHSEDMPWTTTHDIMLDEFPGAMFSWTWEKVTVGDKGGVRDLFSGWPIWNVYFADLNGDGLPELCATVSFGSGIVDTRVIVYDYVNNNLYDLSDRTVYNYILSIENNRLTVTQTNYLGGEVRAIGSMAIIDGELVTFGIDRT